MFRCIFVVYCVSRTIANKLLVPLSAAILSIGAPAAFAASQPDVLPSDGYVMTHWGPKEGLPTADTWPIIQSREGYVWIGTGFGIVRFDGMKFTPFNSKNCPAFRAQQVMAIHEDMQGRIWVGLLSGGVLIYQNGNFTAPPSCDTIAYQSVNGIFADSAGGIYLCTSIGVLRMKGDSATRSWMICRRSRVSASPQLMARSILPALILSARQTPPRPGRRWSRETARRPSLQMHCWSLPTPYCSQAG